MATIDTDYFEQALGGERAMGIFRGKGLEGTLRLCETAWDAGIRAVEVPVTVPSDLEVLAAVVAAGRERGLDVGAGTIVSPELVERVAAVGAAYTVAPGFDLEVVEAGRRLGLPHLPGVATATEVQTSLRHGFTWLKAFPASVLGPAWVSAMLGPFPELRIVATGGVDAGNARGLLDAGARVVALGSAFGSPEALRAVSGLWSAASAQES